jgi:hypothetical protein
MVNLTGDVHRQFKSILIGLMFKMRKDADTHHPPHRPCEYEFRQLHRLHILVQVSSKWNYFDGVSGAESVITPGQFCHPFWTICDYLGIGAAKQKPGFYRVSLDVMLRSEALPDSN